ncbi:protein kinase [bacterium]|nr:protein kinase [bacterium]
MGAVVQITGDSKAKFALEVGQGVTLGRSLDVEVSIDDLRVSRRHAQLALGDRGLFVSDLQSANVTFLNGRRIMKALVRPGDRLQIGNANLTVGVEYHGLNVLDREYRCDTCGRAISLSTFADGDVIEVGDKFICPQCRERQKTPAFSVVELGIVQRLFDEGFEILEKLSISGLVPIFKAKKTSLDQIVAIKALPLSTHVSQKKIARFLQEAKAEARLRHANIVQIFDVRQTKDLLYIVMELIEGQTLHEEIERAGRMATNAALLVGYQVAKALAHAHGKKIVHRDVKPQNIMMSPDGNAKLIDFGLAKNLWEASGQNITAEGETLGTIGYMAPEQVRTAKKADHRADIYGLGATLYHCLGGRAPFTGKSDMEILTSIARADPPPLERLAGVPINVVALVGRMMHKRPEDRFQTPNEVLQAIEKVVAEMLEVDNVSGNVEFLLKLRDDQIDLQKTWRVANQRARQSAVLGSFRDRELVEFLQMIEFNSKTGVVEISGKDSRGKLHVNAGRIVAAECFPQSLMKGLSAEHAPIHRAERAVSVLLQIRNGDFEFTPRFDIPAQECDLRISKVLLDALKARDEAR